LPADTVTTNYNIDGNIVGEKKRYRVAGVVAKTAEKIAFYRHRTVVCRKYAEETQQDSPEIGEVPTLQEQ
jgi:hypothetical protein